MFNSSKFLPSLKKKSTSLLRQRLFTIEIRIYILFFLIIATGFGTVSTGLFSLKNDEIRYFLPYRFNIVEIIRTGQFPLWSPYIYMGFPISGDMQSGAWNPVVWLLALTGRYTLTTLHWELLLYVYLGTLGMFRLMTILSFKKIVCITIAVCYAFSGFMVESGQFICWISCAAFLPYTYLYFIRLLNDPSYSNSAKFTLANFCLLIIGTYPFFFIVNVYFLFIAFVAFFIISWRNHEIKKSIDVFKYLLFSVLMLTLLSAAPLLNFTDLLPFYLRGTSLDLDNALSNSYSLFSSISFLFPFAITREDVNFGNTQIVSRSLYVGVLILPFILKGMITNRTTRWNIILFCILLSFATSLGTTLPFRKWAYYTLPLMNTFRHPSNFRLFITLGLLSFAGKGLQEFFASPDEKNRGMILKIYYLFLLMMIVLGIYFFPLRETNPFHNISISLAGFKALLTLISFRQAVLISLLLQLPFMLVAIALLKKRMYRSLCILAMLNVIVVSQSQLLANTVAKNSVFKINEFIKKQPPGFPIPDVKNPIVIPDEKKQFLYEYTEPVKFFFNKELSLNTYLNNPTILTSYRTMIDDSELLANLKKYNFVYFADSIIQHPDGTNGNRKNFWLQTSKKDTSINQSTAIGILYFKPYELGLTIKTDTANFLVVLQNNYPGWTARIDNKRLPITIVNDTFMGIRIPAGNYNLVLQYQPGWFLPGVLLSVAGMISIVLILIFGARTNYPTRS